MRLKSIKNIQKITKSMKMVAAAKYARAERELKQARVYGTGALENMGIYDDIDADVLRNYQEFALVNIIYYSLKESTTSEQSARMTAMDNASKNACKIDLIFGGICTNCKK
ncbi:UNVERIFIED_CONTAM: hypothetical protein FKN15_035764 [Acipenser sinensis]